MGSKYKCFPQFKKFGVRVTERFLVLQGRYFNQWDANWRFNVSKTSIHRMQFTEIINCIIAFNTQICKWNESGFRPPLCTYRLNWARRTSWGWWDDTVLQTQDSKFEPWRSEAEHATSRSRRLPTILTFTRGWGRNISVSFKPPRPGTEPRTLAWKAAVLTTTLGPPPYSNKQLLNNSFSSHWLLISSNTQLFF